MRTGRMTATTLAGKSAAVDHGEADEDQVAGQGVGEEPDAVESGRTQQHRHQLDRRDQEVERLGHARRERDVGGST